MIIKYEKLIKMKILCCYVLITKEFKKANKELKHDYIF